MLAIILVILGLGAIIIGTLFLLASVLQRWGGGTEPHAIPIGAGFVALGLWLIFKAGGVA